MSLDGVLKEGFVTTSLDTVINWSKTGSLWPWVSACREPGWIADRFFIKPSRIWTASQTPHGMKLVNRAM